MIIWRIEIRSGKAGIALFWKQQKHLNQLFCQLWQTAQNNYVLSPYPINFGPLSDYKEPSCSSAESSLMNHLLTGSYTNAKSPLQGVIRAHLLRYLRIPVRQLGCHYAGEDWPSLGFCNRIRHSLSMKGLQMDFITIFTVFSPITKETDTLIIPYKSFFYSISLINTYLRWFISFRWWFSL